MNTGHFNSTLATPPACGVEPVLPDDLAVCHAMIRELIDALKKEQHEREGIQQRLDLLLRKLYGPKAERFNPDQPWLLPELVPDATPVAEETPAEESPTANDAESDNGTKTTRKGGRNKLPDNLERKRI